MNNRTWSHQSSSEPESDHTSFSIMVPAGLTSSSSWRLVCFVLFFLLWLLFSSLFLTFTSTFNPVVLSFLSFLWRLWALIRQWGAHSSKCQDSKLGDRISTYKIDLMKLEYSRNIPWRYFPGGVNKWAMDNAFEIKILPIQSIYSHKSLSLIY